MPKVNVGNVVASCRDEQCNLINSYCTSSTSSLSFETSLEKVGADNPRWRESIRTGVDAGSPYYLKKVTCDPGSPISVRFLRFRGSMPYLKVKCTGGHLRGWFSTKTVTSDVDPGILATLKGAAIAKFYSKVSETITPVKGLVVMGELRETLRLLAGLILDGLKVMMTLRRQLTDLWVALRARLHQLRTKGEKSAAMERALKDASDRYLQFTFGIEPILADIESIKKVLNERGIRREVIRVSVKDAPYSETQREYRMGYSSGYAHTSLKKRSKLVSRVVGVVEFERPGLSLSNVSLSELGISLREVVPALWELTPFSFLVDYFINVSHVLNTMMYADTRLVYAWVSTKSVSSCEFKITSIRPEPQYPWVVDHSDLGTVPFKHETIYFKREKVTPLDATVRLSIPPLGRKWLNMIALLVQKLTR